MHAKRLGSCHVCKTNDGKYKCPKCEAVSCSLNCCNVHKSKNNCDGNKEKVEFVPLSKMSGDLLRKDMRFLVNLSSKMHVSSREPLLHEVEDRDTSNRFGSLCSAAKAKKIRLFLQPIGMAKHKHNQTYITKSVSLHNEKQMLKTIHWTMSVQFGSHQLLLHDVNETDTFLSVLRNLRQRKFQKLTSNTVVTKLMKQNQIFDLTQQSESDSMEIEHKENILDKYSEYLNDINLIHLPALPNRRRTQCKANETNGYKIARSVMNDILLPKCWNIVSTKCERDDKEKLNIILKIPNHFMYIRVNPAQSILCILRQKIINEYPEFVVLTPKEMAKGQYVITDKMEHHQFGNTIKHNTKIQREKKRLRTEMTDTLNDKKLFTQNRYNRHDRNHRSNKRFHGSANHKFERSSNNGNYNNNSELKARDLFNEGFYEPNQKRMKGNESSVQTQVSSKVFTNPFDLNNTNNSNKSRAQTEQTQNASKDWYLYL